VASAVRSQRQPDSADVIGGGNVAFGVPRQADAEAERAERRASWFGGGQYQAPASLPASGRWPSHSA